VARLIVPAEFIGAEIVGYAHSGDARVCARARRLHARLLPIEGGAVRVEVPA
jgi:hypothetical protein